MPLDSALRGLNDHLRDQNDRSHLFDDPFEEPADPSTARVVPYVAPEDRPTPPDWLTKPWLKHAPNGRYAISYRYMADSPRYRLVHRSLTPVDVVRFLRDHFKTVSRLDVRLWEDPPKDEPIRAGWQWSGRHCSKCEHEITLTDFVIANEEGEPTDDGGYIDRSTVRHAQCPPEHAA